jgi:dTDP-glucose 4,6-dehydratase
MILVTGGAGFIGSHFVLQWIQEEKKPVITLDKLTYAGNLSNLDEVKDHPLHTFILGDICDRQLVQNVLKKYEPIGIVHCAAESHVDRSIASPSSFITTNIVGTSILLEEAFEYWKTLSADKQKTFRFLHLSTDEVYGSLETNACPSTETSSYAPNSPYAASKAASDHLVRAYFQTYGFPILISHASNNYGPRQFPEKLIPLTILNALKEIPIPLYGDGLHFRDWLYVEDHCDALRRLFNRAPPGETYHIATGKEESNLLIVQAICQHLDKLQPRSSGKSYSELIQHVQDRPGHDRRYAMNIDKIRDQLDWHPLYPLEIGLESTILWYLLHREWTHAIETGSYCYAIPTQQAQEGLC